MFNTLYSRDKSFYLTLICQPYKEKILELEHNDNIILLNPNYIVSSYHIVLGVNKGCYNISINKCKSKNLKKEIIHCMTNENKLEKSLKLHSIDNNTENNYYIIFINMNISQINEILKNIGGNEISSINYSKFVNNNQLIESFQIKEDEIKNHEDGILSAVYNRISTKELK